MTLNGGLPSTGNQLRTVGPRNPFHVFIGTTAGVFEATRSFDLSITTDSLPPAAVNESYLVDLEAFGGTPPYRWEISSGSLPPGLSLNPDSGEIAGQALTPGSYDFAVRLTDSVGQTFSKQLTLAVLNSYFLNTAAESAAGGTVTRNPDQLKYLEGSLVDVGTTPNDGYVFTGWSGDASGKSPLIHVQMTGDKNITANYVLLASLPDYYVSSSTLPSAAGAGEIIGGAVSVMVGNQGAIDLNPAGLSVGLYLSSDAAIRTSDMLLWKGRTSIAALGAGATVNLPVDPNLGIPTTVTSGEYYIGVLVDEFERSPSDEANNSASQAIAISAPDTGWISSAAGRTRPSAGLTSMAATASSKRPVAGLDTSNPAQPALISQLSLSGAP
jgi:uncharacterized repeat protein (TIGR02543 family)